MPLERRLQVRLDDERHRRLTAEARQRGISVAAVVREAIDRALAAPGERRAAGTRLLRAPDMDVPDVASLRAELDEARPGFS